jgi:hypothetical protein
MACTNQNRDKRTRTNQIISSQAGGSSTSWKRRGNKGKEKGGEMIAGGEEREKEEARGEDKDENR